MIDFERKPLEWADKVDGRKSPDQTGVKFCNYCGEDNPDKFPKSSIHECRKCKVFRARKNKKEKKDWVIERLGGKCARCGYKEFPCGLDIHHIDPNTRDQKASTYTQWTKEKIIVEIQKCVLLCSPCHRALHYGHWQLDEIELK